MNTINSDVDEHGVAVLTLNRPDALNSFTVEMANELESWFRRAAEDDDIRAVIVTGAGRAFCAGMDLSADGNVFGLDESLDPDPDEFARDFESEPWHSGVRDSGGRVTLAIHACPKPVIAAINGAAVGIGTTMTLAMDARLMSTAARVGLVFGRIGIVNEACSSWFLPRIVGLPKALELLYKADILSAEHALSAGLVTAIHEPDQLMSEARALALSFVSDRSPASLALIRGMIYRHAGSSTPLEAHLEESLAMWHTSQRDGKEGVHAFVEKRPANFRDPASQIPAVTTRTR
jgi:enoyl-CoA hydratase/carnithine racemase